MLYTIDELPVSLGTVKEMPNDEQPREKMMLHGAEYLTDAELLAILLRTGTKQRNVLDTAKFLLQKANGLGNLYKKTWKDLSLIPGIGQVKGITLEAVLELSRRIQRVGYRNSEIFNNPTDLGKRYVSMMRDLTHEEVYMITLNSKLQIISEKKMNSGTASQSLIDVRRVVKEAMLDNARSVVLVHNHPGGNLAVSQSDKSITRRIREALKLLDIYLVDHFIISGNEYLSFANEGLLD
jgi:DNA repair protein RadC